MHLIPTCQDCSFTLVFDLLDCFQRTYLYETSSLKFYSTIKICGWFFLSVPCVVENHDCSLSVDFKVLNILIRS